MGVRVGSEDEGSVGNRWGVWVKVGSGGRVRSGGEGGE